MNYLRAAAAISAMAALAWMPSGAWAQAAGDQATQTSQNGAADQGQVLQEVVVTAEKRSTDIQTTAISMSAISSADLQQQNQTRLVDLQLTTPSFTAANINGEYATPNIRGVGNNQFNATNTSGVTVIKDGLYAAGTHDQGDPYFDEQDIEVLRGPQGDLSNFASDGGAVIINSANPNFKPGLTGYGTFQLGNYTDQKVEVALNDSLTDTLAVRLAAYEEGMHSFYRDDGSINAPGDAKPEQDPGATDDKSFRVGVLWKPTDGFQALLKIQGNTMDDFGEAAEPNQATFTLPASAVALGCPSSIGTGGVVPAGPGGVCHSTYYTYSTHVPFLLNYVGQYGRLPAEDVPLISWINTLVMTGTLPNGIQIVSTSGMGQTRFNTVEGNNCFCSDPSGGASYQYIPDDNSFQEEVDVLSPATGKFQWIVGGVGYNAPVVVDSFSETSTPPYTLALPSVSSSSTYAIKVNSSLFGHISYQISPAWQVQFGVRGNWDYAYQRSGPEYPNVVERDTATVNSTKDPCPPYINPYQPGYGCLVQPGNGHYSDRVPTGKLTLNWTPTQGQFIYAFYARGYKPGAVIAGSNNSYNDEFVNDYELGWKVTALGGHLQNALDGYYMFYQGMQQTVEDITIGASSTKNLGGSTLKGIEDTFNLIEGGFGFQFAGAYEKTSLGALEQPLSYALPPAASNSPQCTGPGGTVVGAGQKTCFNYTPYLVNLSGEQLPFAPEFSANVSLDYRIPLFGGTLDPKLQFTYTGKQYGSIFDIPYYEMSSRHLMNAYLTYDKGAWESEAFMTNVTNQVYINGNFGGGSVMYGNPMQIGIRFRRDF